MKMIRLAWEWVKKNPGATLVMFLITAIFALFMPIIDLLRSLLVNILLTVSVKYSDFLYLLAAKNDPNLLSELSASFSMMVFSYALLFMLVYFQYRYEKYIKSIKGKEKLNTTKNVSKNRIKFILVTGMLILVVMQLMIFFEWATFTSAHNIALTFRNDLVILEASGKDKEVKKLRAQWVQMKTKQDYNIIYKNIELLRKP